METLCYALLAGYPVVGGVIAVLWRKWEKERKEVERLKDQRIRELETFKEMIERRIK
jgi:hypothetical protein